MGTGSVIITHRQELRTKITETFCRWVFSRALFSLQNGSMANGGKSVDRRDLEASSEKNDPDTHYVGHKCEGCTGGFLSFRVKVTIADFPDVFTRKILGNFATLECFGSFDPIFRIDTSVGDNFPFFTVKGFPRIWLFRTA